MEGDGLVDGVTVEDGEVTVNFLPLIADGLQSSSSSVCSTTPRFRSSPARAIRAEQIEQLSQGLGRDLPADFGQIVVYRSDSLAPGVRRCSEPSRRWS